MLFYMKYMENQKFLNTFDKCGLNIKPKLSLYLTR